MSNLSLPQQLARMDGDRLRAYRENLEFYAGAQWTGSPHRWERRLTFNYARTFLDKVTSYLMTDMSFVIGPTDSSAEAAERANRADEALRRMHEDNRLEQLDFDTELDTAILGDGCYKVTWDPQERRVRVTAPDVQGLFAWWVADDVGRVWQVASRYHLTTEQAQTLYGVKSAQMNRRAGRATVVGRGRRGSSGCGWTTRWCRSGPTPTASYRSSYSPTCASPSGSGDSRTSRPSWSRHGS